MRRSLRFQARFPLAAFLVCVAPLVGCERPPMEVTQGDFRGLAVEQVRNPRLAAASRDANQVPEPTPPVPSGGPAFLGSSAVSLPFSGSKRY